VVSLMDMAPTMLSLAGLPIPEHMHGTVAIDTTGASTAANEYVFSGRDRMDEQQDSSRTVRDKRFRYTRHRHPDRSGMQHHEYADKFSTWAEFRRLAFEEANQLAVGETPSKMTPLQRAVVAATKPVEELFDIFTDPHEERNLANDPGHRDDLERMRAALDGWHERIDDLADMPEADLAASWRPGGIAAATAPVEITTDEDGRVHATCATPGARIGWTTTPENSEPHPMAAHPMARMMGVEPDGRDWQIYRGPLETAGTVWLKAWRIGYTPSEAVMVELEDAVAVSA